MKTDKPTTSPGWRAALFVLAQMVPPILMFYFVFGHWDPGVTIILGPALLYSAIRIVILLYRKQFRLLLRPALTVMFAVIIIGMGGYYAAQSALYVKQLAQDMHAQCNRDGVCKLPPGEWKANDRYPALFESHTAGLVPMTIVLTFNEYEPTIKQPCVAQSPKSGCSNQQPFTAFHLVRLLDDFSYSVYGGVGRSLNIPGSGNEGHPR